MNVMTAFTSDTAYGTYGRRDRIRLRRGIIGCGAGFTVALDETGGIRYAGENRWGQKEASAWQEMLSVSCGPDYVLGLHRNGAVLSAGRSDFHGIHVNSWACVSAISCGPRHAAALLGNGQILASGENKYGQCETGTWSDMVDVCCGRTFTVGLRSDGRLLVAGGHKALHHTLEHWKQVAGIFTDEEGRHVLAITYGEGRLLSTGHLPLETGRWRNLVYVAASARGIVAITAQGRLLSTNREDRKKLERMGKDCTACAMGPGHLAVLCRDGEVVSLGHNEFGQCTTARWGKLFGSFEDFSGQRRADAQAKERTEKHYQQRLSEAKRCIRRIACGERLTACIQADGRVSATAGLRGVKGWQNVCALSCGSAHILVLHKDGTVSADGNNVGHCCRVSEWRGIKAVLAGKYHSLGLCEDGTVVFAGWNVHEQGNVSDWRGIRLLRSTDTYTVGVDQEGKIHTSGKKLPFTPELLDMSQWSDLIDLAVSEHHMVGLRRDGRVVGVGDHTCGSRNEKGELTDLLGWRGVRSISVGDGFTAGLCYGGHVLAAGKNDYGQCETEAWHSVVSVCCGRTFTAALTAEGRVLTVGQHMSDSRQNLSPDEMGGAVMAWEKAESTGYEPFHTQWMTDVLALNCGKEHLVAVDRYGQVMAEGLDLDGQCTASSAFVLFRDLHQLDGFGIFTTSVDLQAPNSVTQGDARADRGRPVAERRTSKVAEAPVTSVKCFDAKLIKQVSAPALAGRYGQGLTHGVYLTSEGQIQEIGERPFLSADDLPKQSYQWVSSGLYHAVAVTDDGSLVTFGRVPEDREGSVLIQAARDQRPDGAETASFCSVSCGVGHTSAVTTDGSVYAAGKNDHGQCHTAAWRNVTATACGAGHTVALTRDGHALATGDDTYGQCRVGDWSRLVMVACGENHTVGLRADGRVVAVGDDRLGQCAVSGARNVVYVACLPEATLCVDADGKVTAFGGTGEFRQKLSALRDIVAVYACEYRLTALSRDGRIICVN